MSETVNNVGVGVGGGEGVGSLGHWVLESVGGAKKSYLHHRARIWRALLPRQEP